jgi:hypothetical protein
MTMQISTSRKTEQMSRSYRAGSTHHGETQSVKSLVQRVEGSTRVLDTARALETLSVEADIPVGQISDEVE